MAHIDPRRNGTTLYAQLVAYFRERIADGTLPPGARLPPELELVEQHGMSRNTVRQAMATLVHEGLVERVQGRGTFVRQTIEQRVIPARTSRRIGVVLMYAEDQLNMELLIGIDQAAKSRGYQVSFSYSEDRSSQQARDIERLRADGVAGLIIFPVSNEADNAAVAALQADNVPLVLVDRYLSARPTDSVTADNYAGGYRATEHLLILGHTRIAFVYLTAANRNTTSVRERWEGHRAALRDHGLTYDERLVFEYAAEALVPEDDAYRSFMAQADRPSAICLVNDIQVPLLYQAARHAGVRIPEDLAVVSFDDLSFASHLSPPLTTVAQPRLDIGIRAAHLLINRIEGDTEPPKRIVLPTYLVVRESCGAHVRIKQSVDNSAAAPAEVA